jgi:hypothetical protein
MDAALFIFFFSWFFSGNKQKVNSTFGFRFWTFINVHFKNPYGAFENDPLKMVSEHNALFFIFLTKKSVSVIFYPFLTEKMSEPFLRYYKIL